MQQMPFPKHLHTGILVMGFSGLFLFVLWSAATTGYDTISLPRWSYDSVDNHHWFYDFLPDRISRGKHHTGVRECSPAK